MPPSASPLGGTGGGGGSQETVRPTQEAARTEWSAAPHRRTCTRSASMCVLALTRRPEGGLARDRSVPRIGAHPERNDRTHQIW